jgi:hypothetical protein
MVSLIQPRGSARVKSLPGVFDVDLPGLVGDGPRERFQGFVLGARDKVFRSGGSDGIVKETSGLVHQVMDFAGYPPQDQLRGIRLLFWSVDRAGGDCDAYGSWQPRFLAELYYLVAKDAGLPPRLEGAGLDVSDEAGSMYRTGSEGVSLCRGRLVYLREGD